MAKIRTEGLTIDYSDDGWAEFKKWLDGSYASLAYGWVDEGSAYSIVAVDGRFYRTFSINKADAAEFEAHYKVFSAADPVTGDKKKFVRSSAYTLGTRLYIAGCGDDRSSGVGKGPRFEMEHSGSGLSAWFPFQFNDWVELGGGGMWYEGAEFGDYATFRMYAPATEIVPNPGAGNCDLHPSGILLPAAGDGDYDVDLITADKFVPLISKGGYWLWSYPDTGCGECVAAPSGDGNCNLIPAEVAIHTYVADVGILGDGYLNVTFPGVDPTRFLPQWKMACRLNNTDGLHTIHITWELEVARMNGAVAY